MIVINVPTLIIALSVGLFFSYVIRPQTDVIYVYPTPENIDRIQYEDNGGTCFGFKSSETSCPNDKSKIRHYPVQNPDSDSSKYKGFFN
jgi:hypothetical protein